MEFVVESAEGVALDPFSTSPTDAFKGLVLSPSVRCKYGAPFFAFQRAGLRYGVVQGCCNHWECPRCGVQVAKQHYGRIVEGAREVSKHAQLWFITITCAGGDLTEAEATKNYLAWSSKFLDTCYTRAKRERQHWFYVQVTEKQKRGHPHSHILTTFRPPEIEEGVKENWVTTADGRRVLEYDDALRSDWLQAAVCNAGLGEQYDVSAVETVEAASRYVAKYMFKEAQFQAHYPKGWKRVRYSQTWPDRPVEKTDAFVLLGADDWHKLADRAAVVDCAAGDAYESACYFLHGSDTIVVERKEADNGNHR